MTIQLPYSPDSANLDPVANKEIFRLYRRVADVNADLTEHKTNIVADPHAQYQKESNYIALFESSNIAPNMGTGVVVLLVAFVAKGPFLDVTYETFRTQIPPDTAADIASVFEVFNATLTSMVIISDAYSAIFTQYARVRNSRRIALSNLVPGHTYHLRIRNHATIGPTMNGVGNFISGFSW